MKRTVLMLVALLFATSLTTATPLLDVYLPDRDAREALLRGRLDVVELHADRAVVVGWPGDPDRLRGLGLAFDVIEEDIEAFYRGRLDHELDDMGGYPTYDEIVAWWQVFVLGNPDIAAGPDTIGYTLEDRAILAVKISDNPTLDEDEPEVFYNAAIHAREVITPLVLENFAQFLADGYGSDPRVTDIIDNREIWIVPVVNPDGYTYNEETDPDGGGMWRKNKRRIDGTLYGVDLNRNFDFMWGLDDQGSSPWPDDETYRGDAPASEPETVTIETFTNAHPFVIAVNYHSYSNLILFPYGYTDDVQPDDYPTYVALADYANETLGWGAGSAGGLLYSVNGEATDWMEGASVPSPFAFVFEVGSGNDGFWPATSRISTLVDEQLEPLLRLSEVADNPHRLLPPPVPVVLLPDTVAAPYTLAWTTPPDSLGNEPVAYDVIEAMGLSLSDDAETDRGALEAAGFVRSQNRAFSGSWSYYSQSDNQSRYTLTARNTYTVQPGDTLRFQTWFDIEPDYDYAYVQALLEDGTSVNLAGNITTVTDPHGSNEGNGITGSSDGWLEAWFPLDDLAGQPVRFRFVYDTDTYVIEEGIYLDDLSPIPWFDSMTEIAAALEDTSLVVEEGVEDSPETRWYLVRAVDAQDDSSAWSEPASTVVLPVDVVAGAADALPARFEVGAVYPNPFNPSAELRVSLPLAADLTVTITDILGREAGRLNLGRRPAGTHSVTVDGSRWASGIYFIRVEAREAGGAAHRAVRKALLLK